MKKRMKSIGILGLIAFFVVVIVVGGVYGVCTNGECSDEDDGILNAVINWISLDWLFNAGSTLNPNKDLYDISDSPFCNPKFCSGQDSCFNDFLNIRDDDKNLDKKSITGNVVQTDEEEDTKIRVALLRPDRKPLEFDKLAEESGFIVYGYKSKSISLSEDSAQSLARSLKCAYERISKTILGEEKFEAHNDLFDSIKDEKQFFFYYDEKIKEPGDAFLTYVQEFIDNNQKITFIGISYYGGKNELSCILWHEMVHDILIRKYGVNYPSFISESLSQMYDSQESGKIWQSRAEDWIKNNKFPTLSKQLSIRPKFDVNKDKNEILDYYASAYYLGKYLLKLGDSYKLIAEFGDAAQKKGFDSAIEEYYSSFANEIGKNTGKDFHLNNADDLQIAWEFWMKEMFKCKDRSNLPPPVVPEYPSKDTPPEYKWDNTKSVEENWKSYQNWYEKSEKTPSSETPTHIRDLLNKPFDEMTDEEKKQWNNYLKNLILPLRSSTDSDLNDYTTVSLGEELKLSDCYELFHVYTSIDNVPGIFPSEKAKARKKVSDYFMDQFSKEKYVDVLDNNIKKPGLNLNVFNIQARDIPENQFINDYGVKKDNLPLLILRDKFDMNYKHMTSGVRAGLDMSMFLANSKPLIKKCQELMNKPKFTKACIKKSQCLSPEGSVVDEKYETYLC